MKKLLIALTVWGIGLSSVFAQCEEFPVPETSKYRVATNSFWANWYLQAGINISLYNPYGTELFKDNWHDARTYGVEAAVGKWFVPSFGLRMKMLWNNGLFPKAFRNQLSLSDYTPAGDDGGYGALYFEPLFNLSNIVCGYNENRIWNLILVTRGGYVRRWDNASDSPVIGAGLETVWRVYKRFNIYAEAVYNCTTEHYWAWTSGIKLNKDFNGYITASVGVQYDLSKSYKWSRAVSLEDYEALADEACQKLANLRQQLKDEQDENDRLRDLLAKQPKKVAASDVTSSIAASVFFDLNSSKIRSRKDQINIEAVAEAAKRSGSKVRLSGSADSDTGSSAWNQKLSEARANSVADELVRLGVNRSDIEIVARGGIHEVEPYVLNRRVVLELK